MKAELTIQLRRDEGEVLTAYQDHLGYWTLGIGRLIDKRRGGGISPEESAYLLNNDIDKRIGELRRRLPWTTKLDDARFGALVNLSFQLGVDGLIAFKTTLALLEQAKYEAAGNQLLNSKLATQTPTRAQRIAKQLRTGVWQ